jgi:aspartate carbamoyltransferase catalytic subunit
MTESEATGELRLSHVLTAGQFTPATISELFAAAVQMEMSLTGSARPDLAGKVMATLFYEPSTRTRLSFESAMLRLGGQVISTENARDFSSAIKGETLEDTVRIVSGYADCIVLRHPEEGAAARAAAVAGVPVINAGDGKGEHPTQALLDLYTIAREVGRLDQIHVVMVGDLANGRTVHSLAQLLATYPGLRLTLVAPEPLRMSRDMVDRLRHLGVALDERDDLMAAVADADVVYQTRLQLERMSAPLPKDDQDRQRFRIGPEVMAELPPGAILMHPLPRVGEIDPAVDADPRAAYFRQARNGVPVRMALLSAVLGK